jgi:hypothetical protein
MADEVRIVVDPAAVRELMRDWSGPVGQAVDAVTQEVADTARFLAPVSPVGSPLAPPGYLRANTRVSAEHHYTDDGSAVLGLAGAPNYPFAFIANDAGITRNPRAGKRRGRASVRRATDDFLAAALEAAPFITFGETG